MKFLNLTYFGFLGEGEPSGVFDVDIFVGDAARSVFEVDIFLVHEIRRSWKDRQDLFTYSLHSSARTLSGDCQIR